VEEDEEEEEEEEDGFTLVEDFLKVVWRENRTQDSL
jgi:hypothetical protein